MCVRNRPKKHSTYLPICFSNDFQYDTVWLINGVFYLLFIVPTRFSLVGNNNIVFYRMFTAYNYFIIKFHLIYVNVFNNSI